MCVRARVEASLSRRSRVEVEERGAQSKWDERGRGESQPKSDRKGPIADRVHETIVLNHTPELFELAYMRMISF